MFVLALDRNLTRAPGKIIMTFFIKMNARTGGTRLTKQKRRPASRKTGWLRCRQHLKILKKKLYGRKTAVKKRTASPDEFTDWLYQQSNVIIKLATDKT